MLDQQLKGTECTYQSVPGIKFIVHFSKYNTLELQQHTVVFYLIAI